MFGMIKPEFSPSGQVGSNPGVFNPIASVMPGGPGPGVQPSLGNYQWGMASPILQNMGQAPASVPGASGGAAVAPQRHASGWTLPYDTGTVETASGDLVQRKGMLPQAGQAGQAGKPTTGAGCRPGMPCWTAGLQNFIGRRMANG